MTDEERILKLEEARELIEEVRDGEDEGVKKTLQDITDDVGKVVLVINARAVRCR